MTSPILLGGGGIPGPAGPEGPPGASLAGWHEVAGFTSADIIAANDAAALAGGGIVYFPPGTYTHGGATTIEVSGSVSWWGAGKEATQLRLTHVDAKISFGSLATAPGKAGPFGNMTITGTGVATTCLVIARGSNRQFLQLSVTNALQDNVWVQALQNSTFAACDFRGAGRDNFVIDIGSKNIWVYGMTLSTAGRHNLRIDMTADHPTNPTTIKQCEHIAFYGGLFEEPGIDATDSCAEIISGDDILFSGVTINGSITTGDYAVKATRRQHPGPLGPTGEWLNVSVTFTGSCLIRNGNLAVFRVEGVNTAGKNAEVYVEGGCKVTKAGGLAFSTDAFGDVRLAEIGGNYATLHSGSGTLVYAWPDADAAVATHSALADPHVGYQLETGLGAASGYASLDANTRVPAAQLGTGIPDSTMFLRGDRAWAVPPNVGARHVVNVADFTNPNGIDNNTAGVQAALDEAKPGDRVHFGPSPGSDKANYRIDTPLIVPEQIEISGVGWGQAVNDDSGTSIKLVGTPVAATWNKKGVFTTAAYNGAGTAPGESIYVHDLKIMGGGNTLGNGIVLMNRFVRIERVCIVGFNGTQAWDIASGGVGSGYGIVFSGYNHGGLTMSANCVNNEVKDVRVQTQNSRLFTIDDSSANYTDGTIHDFIIMIQPVSAQALTHASMDINRGGGWLLDNVHSNGCGGSTIVFQNSLHARVVNCYLDGWGTASSGGTHYAVDFKNLVSGTGGTAGIISNNTFRWREEQDSGVFIASRFKNAAIPAECVFSGNNGFVQVGTLGTPRILHVVGNSGTNPLRLAATGNEFGNITGDANVFQSAMTFGTDIVHQENNSWQYRSAAPTAGFWPKLTRIWNTGVAAGLSPGWVAIDDARTFQAMAAVAA